MERRIWEKVIEEIGDWPVSVTLMAHGAGEPLLYKELYDLLMKAKQKSNIYLGFMCNGMLLDEKWAETLVKLKIDWLAFSIDGTVAKTHDHFRVNANLDQIEANIGRLIEIKKNARSRVPVLSFNMVGYSEILNQAEDYVRKWLPHASSVTVSRFRPIGSKKLWEGEPVVEFRPCPLLWSQMVIGYDGRVGLCCEDIHLDVDLGNVYDRSLQDIFNESNGLAAHRKSHEKKEIEGLDLCSECHVWGGDIPIEHHEFLLDNMRVEKRITPAFTAFHKKD
jgi:radical SAM protein with 4Fe4S-binding SPASM domain